ncbi:MAG: cyclase family protein [Holophagae bacterium]|nr:cyclase family protein [Holophagae bacterium]
MKYIDLTCPVSAGDAAVCRERLIVQRDGEQYSARVYDFAYESKTGTYIDFPGHIESTDDGLGASSWPLEKLFRVETTVIHLDKPDRSGAVTADELASACSVPVSGGGLIINALGNRRFDEVEERSVYLDSSAVSWIVQQGIHLFVSDIYESQALHGVFSSLFAVGIATVCSPVNLHLLDRSTLKLTALSPCFDGVTQLPCRLVAEMEL